MRYGIGIAITAIQRIASAVFNSLLLENGNDLALENGDVLELE